MNKPSMEVKICRGDVVLIDEEDAHIMHGKSWYLNSRYVKATNGGKLLHRLIMKAGEKQIVDHINGNVFDNRKENLRICSHSQNMRNRAVHETNKAGFRGVHFDKHWNKWIVIVQVDKMRHRWGFDTKEEAVQKAVAARKELHGEFYSRPQHDESCA